MNHPVRLPAPGSKLIPRTNPYIFVREVISCLPATLRLSFHILLAGKLHKSGQTGLEQRGSAVFIWWGCSQNVRVNWTDSAVPELSRDPESTENDIFMAADPLLPCQSSENVLERGYGTNWCELPSPAGLGKIFLHSIEFLVLFEINDTLNSFFCNPLRTQ